MVSRENFHAFGFASGIRPGAIARERASERLQTAEPETVRASHPTGASWRSGMPETHASDQINLDASPSAPGAGSGVFNQVAGRFDRFTVRAGRGRPSDICC